MGLNIQNEEAQHLATELAALTGETLTRAVIVALRERIARLRQQRPVDDLITRAEEIIRQFGGALRMTIMLPCSMMSRASRNDHRSLSPVGHSV